MKIKYFLFFLIVSILVIKSNNNCCNNCCNNYLKNDKNIKDLNKNKGNKINGNNEDIKYKKNNKDDKNNDGDKKDNENKKNEQNNKYYLASGYDIDLPLNIEWAKCNCSYLGLFRFFLSDNYFLDKLINKKTSIFTEDQKKRKKDQILMIKNNNNIINNTSELFKKILKIKGNYNKEITEILDIISKDHGCHVSTQFFDLINFYFYETFYLTIFNKGNSTYQYSTYQLPENLDNINDTNKYYLIYNSSNDKIKINEFIEKKQFDNTKKKYELIGVIGICGNIENTTLGDTDFVSILPVFDKNKVKKGYVIYQFSDKSEIISIDELNKLDKFGNWKNPRFYLLIYREIKS